VRKVAEAQLKVTPQVRKPDAAGVE